MPGYLPIGPRAQTATADTTEQNPGKYTNHWQAPDLDVDIPFFEVHHIVIENANVLDSVTFKIGSNSYTVAVAGFGGVMEWDPVNPMLLRPGDEVYAFWTTASSVTPAPKVTLWLRFDSELDANQPYAVRGSNA